MSRAGKRCFLVGILAMALLSPGCRGQQAYPQVNGPYYEGLLHMILVDGAWTSPAAPAFSRAHDDSPAFSPDGSSIYFVSWRGGSEDIWFVERTADGWSDPKALPQTVNSLIIRWQLSIAGNGDLYFGAKVTEDDDQDIFRAALVDGQYAKAERLGSPVNTDNLYEHSPYIARDGSYLLFSRVNAQLNRCRPLRVLPQR